MNLRVEISGEIYEMSYWSFEKMVDSTKCREIGDYLFFEITGGKQLVSVYKQHYHQIKREHLIGKIIE
jgi:hypothetical protein